MTYYKDELLNLIETWSIEQLEKYIQELEERLIYNKDQLRDLRALRRRKMRGRNPKDTGTRGGL